MPGNQPSPDPLTVALLEEDAVLCLSLALVFEDWGLRLVTGRSPADLLDTLAEEGLRADVLVANYRVAGAVTTGGAIPQLLAALPGAVPVIVTSGDTAALKDDMIRREGWRVVEKPYDPDTLRDCIEAALCRPV